MRILEFEVKKQRLVKRRACDFSGLVRGSVNYLSARLYFTNDEWQQCSIKIARFWVQGREYAVLLDENDSCIVPKEAVNSDTFGVSVLGVAKTHKIETNAVYVRQGE